MGSTDSFQEELRRRFLTSKSLRLRFIKKGKSTYFQKDDSEQTNHLFIKKYFLPHMNQDVFDDLYNQAIGGSGCENDNMINIASSALFSFLFFSSISSNCPLIIDGVSYVKVCFEYKNRTLNGTTDFAPSNIDVVLSDENFENLLFIESKFGEYYYSQVNNYQKLSKQYLQKGATPKIVNELIETKNKTFTLDSDLHFFDNEKKHYFEGIKQMITHISGLSNFTNGRFYSQNSRFEHDKMKINIEEHYQAKIRLQEIVYDFGEFSSVELHDYECLQHTLLNLNSIKDIGFTINSMTTYQKLDRNYIDKLPNIVKKLYGLN